MGGATDTPDIAGDPNVVTRSGRRVAIIGAGRVGQAVGSLLREANVPVVAVTARSVSAAKAAALVTGGRADTDNAAAAASADIVLITVPDDAIAGVVEQVAKRGAFRSGMVVAHMSGAHGLEPLRAARDAGAAVGSMHPLQSFATSAHAVRDLPGSVFGLTADEGARETLLWLVETIGGTSVDVVEEARPLYHAAAVMASNGFVAVEDIATDMLVRAGFDERTARRALVPLVKGTTTNIRRYGPREALTGPISRGDVDTVRAHIRALADAPDSYREAYRILNMHAVDMAEDAGWISARSAQELRDVLEDAR